MLPLFTHEGRRVVRLGEIVMILDLHRQGVSVSAIARRAGLDRKTVRKYLERGLEPPAYGPRPPRETKLAPFERYLRERVAAFPELTASRLLREIRDLGFTGGYTTVKDFLRDVRPSEPAAFELRFETRPVARRRSTSRISAPSLPMSPAPSGSSGCSRWCSAIAACCGDVSSCTRTCRRCHAAAFEALGGVPEQILYDRMRTVFHRKDPEAGHIVFNRTLLEFANHYGYLPKACKPYRAKTKGKVERPFRYSREDFF